MFLSLLIAYLRLWFCNFYINNELLICDIHYYNFNLVSIFFLIFKNIFSLFCSYLPLYMDQLFTSRRLPFLLYSPVDHWDTQAQIFSPFHKLSLPPSPWIITEMRKRKENTTFETFCVLFGVTRLKSFLFIHNFSFILCQFIELLNF